jgi:hypothetical protein
MNTCSTNYNTYSSFSQHNINPIGPTSHHPSNSTISISSE